MAIPDACSLWIEQRVQEELDSKSETGASLREIGRAVAAEVEKYFEAKVSPNTIYQKVRRTNAGTNVPPEKNNKKTNTYEELEKLEKPKHGGAREGAGRKPKQQKTDDELFEEDMKKWDFDSGHRLCI